MVKKETISASGLGSALCSASTAKHGKIQWVFSPDLKSNLHFYGVILGPQGLV